MKHQLSYCEVEQLSDNIFEKTPKEGVVVDKNCLDECWSFWNNLTKKPFGLLVNWKNQFSFSFEGSRDIGKYSLIQKTAILINESDHHSKKQLSLALQVKKMNGHYYNHKVFTDREEAINWLSCV